jgi:hypothetical protein
MSEPEQIEFTERIHRPILTRGLVRGGVVLGSALLFVVGVMSAMGASPSPSTGTDPSTGAQPSPGTTAVPTTPDADPNRGPFMGGKGFGFGFGGHGGFGIGGVTITAINGSNLSLKTDDGWTRTIAVTSDTVITRAGTTIAIGDLEVGDSIVFRQERQTDGTYTITEIRVVLPTVAGHVTKVDGTTITVLRRDGTTQVIHVDGSTTYQVDGVTNPTLSDIKVDSVIVAQGTQRADGSLDADVVGSGFGRGWDHDGDGPGMPGGKMPDGTSPSASPAPSTTPG